jgi:starch phosphorylase
VLLLFQVSENALFDVQIKRIHEYKRQLLNVLSLIHRYECIKVAVHSFNAKPVANDSLTIQV